MNEGQPEGTSDWEAGLKGPGVLFAGDVRLHQVVAPELQRMRERERVKARNSETENGRETTSQKPD